MLSKGHGGPVMYATLGLKGYYPIESAYTLNQPGTDFPSHTDRNKTIGVDLTTGSLGQGMSEAIGAALGSRVQGRGNHVFVAIGDGEADEGQIWEGAQFAAHYKLGQPYLPGGRQQAPAGRRGGGRYEPRQGDRARSSTHSAGMSSM